jgi:hypothetical protein
MYYQKEKYNAHLQERKKYKHHLERQADNLENKFKVSYFKLPFPWYLFPFSPWQFLALLPSPLTSI